MRVFPPPDNCEQDLVAWFHEGIAIGVSAIHGHGVFAQAPIEAGGIIMRIGGFLLTAASRGTSLVMPSTAIGVSEDVIVAEFAESRRDISDYLNHGCSPNAGFLDALTLVAVTDIAPGKEITVDYGYCEADQSWVLKQDCRCGSPDCRRTVRGTDWQREDVAQRFLRWASPFIRRRIRNRLVNRREL